MAEDKMISIIEDDDSLRTALVGLLRSLGYRARGFESAEAFLAVQDGLCSCVITDIHMPGMSGIELAAKLREMGYAAPVVMITARTEPAVEARAYAGGAICVLHKPFDTAELLDCVERALAP